MPKPRRLSKYLSYISNHCPILAVTAVSSFSMPIINKLIARTAQGIVVNSSFPTSNIFFLHSENQTQTAKQNPKNPTLHCLSTSLFPLWCLVILSLRLRVSFSLNMASTSSSDPGMKAEASGGENSETVIANDQLLLCRGLKKAKKERGCTAKERISKMPPCTAGKRSSIYRGVTR